MSETKGAVYVCGPMRGYERFNFDAFQEAADTLRAAGWAVQSPHEHDIAIGFDPRLGLDEQDFDLKAALAWDARAVLTADRIAALPGWEHSKGARAEVGLARAAEIPVHAYQPTVSLLDEFPVAEWELDLVFGGPLPRVYEWVAEDHETPTDDLEPPQRLLIHEEAYNLVYGARGDDYGPPVEDFRRTGRMWAAILGLEDVTAKQVALCMIAVKLSREVHRPKRDNLVDLVGYTLCAHRVETGQ